MDRSNQTTNSVDKNVVDMFYLAFYNVQTHEIIASFQTTNALIPTVDDFVYFGESNEVGREIEDRETNMSSDGEHYIVVDRQFGYMERNFEIESESLGEASMITAVTIFVEPHDSSEEDNRADFRIPEDNELF